MPKSDEVFAGMSDTLPPGMFPGMVHQPSMGGMSEPSADEMEEAAMRVRYGKTPVLKDFRTGTYDLSDPEDRDRYRRDVMALYGLLASRSGVVSHLEKKLETSPVPRMIVHMEWYEYAVEKTDRLKEKGDEAAAGKTGRRKSGAAV